MKKLFEKYREIIVYIIVGLLTTVVSYGVRFGIIYSFAAILSVSKESAALNGVATAIGWVAGVTFAFIPNKKWVFRNDEGGKTIMAQFLKFVSSRVGTGILELLIGAFGPMILVSCGYKSFKLIVEIDAVMLVGLVSIVLVTVLNYVLSKLLVFRKSKKNEE